MISNDDKGQILQDIGGHLQNSLSKQCLTNQSINRKDKENYIEIKKVVEGQSYKYSDYQSRNLKTFTNLNKTNLYKSSLQNCESNNEYFTKMSVKQLYKSKENLTQNQFSAIHKFRSKSASSKLISQNYQKSENINIQFIQNYEDQRIKNIAEDLKSKIQSNLNSKLKHYFIKYSKQIQSRLLPNQDLQSNDQNQIYFHNSCLSLQEFFHQKSIELKQKFLEQQTQIIQEKLQIIQNKVQTIETTKKSQSSSYDIPINTPKKQINKFYRESKQKLRNYNDQNQTKLLNSSNLILHKDYLINYNHEDSQTQNQIQNNLDDNSYFQDELQFNEVQNQNLSNDQISMSSPIILSYMAQSQNKLILNDERNSPLIQSKKENRYMNLIQSFKSFHINQTPLKEIETFDSIQVNDLNHISEFSIFKDEKQNCSQNSGVYYEIEQYSNLQNYKEFLIESDYFDQQNIQSDFKQDHYINSIKQVHIEQIGKQNFEYTFSSTPKKFILKKQESFQYNQQLNK